MVELVQEGEPVQEGAEASEDGDRRPGRVARDRDLPEASISAKTLLERLEKQSGQLAAVRAKRTEIRRTLRQQTEQLRQVHEALDEERAACARLEGQLDAEKSALSEAVRNAEEARMTASALEGQLHLLRAQLETRPPRRFGFPRSR